MHIFEEVEEIDKYNQFVETLYAIVRPEDFNKYNKKKKMIRQEEGVDQVIYSGEDDWQSIMKELGEFGFSNLDPFGEGLNK